MKESITKLTIRRIIAYVVLIILAVLSLFAFYILIINSTRAHSEIQKGFSMLPGQFAVANFKNMLKSTVTPILSGVFNSLFISTATAIVSIYFSSMTAYGIYAYDFKLKNIAFKVILMIMMVPTQISTVGFIQLINKIGLTDSFIPLILPAVASPVVFFFMIQYMEGALPMEIVEASRIDGANEFITFNKIVLPVLKPALAVQAIFTFVGSWNNYFVPALLLESANKKTLPILIAQLRSADFTKFNMGQLYITIAMAIVPILIVYLLLSKHIVEGVAVGSVK